MNTPNDAIAFALERSKMMVNRFAGDLTAQELHHRPTAKANCAAWLIGHLTLGDRRLLDLLGAEKPALPEGYEKRFSREEGCPQAEDFGDVSGLLTLFNQHRDLVIA